MTPMNNPYVMIWFLATAAAILVVLTVGTLAAAEILPSRKRQRSGDRKRSERSS
jgi:hypothetical protein